MEPLLKMEQISIDGKTDEKWTPIIKGIDLTLNRGEIIGLIGESGAGKSTLGIASMAYARQGCRISSGSIRFKGRQLMGADSESLRKIRGNRIAYVAQSAAASFNPAYPLIRQYAEAPVQHKVMSFKQAAGEAREIYRQLLLPDPDNIGYRYPHQVSGGQLQRAMVAMAMACRPDLIIFDEPTTALDVTTQIEVLAAIKKIVKQFNTAAIYITHDLAVVAQIVNRIMVLRHGKVVEENDAEQIISNPLEDYTKKLLSVRTIKEDKTFLPEKDSVILELRGITAGYSEKKEVLKDINLKIKKGRTIALVGESGSGKSTVARVITGLLPPKKGSITYNGVHLSPSLKGRDKETLRRIQMIYQMPDTALNPKQKISAVIGRPLELYFGVTGKEQKKMVIELLEKIKLSEKYYSRYPGELSGGEKQRICIARALAARPELIICDEVTSALDQLVAEGILKLLIDLQNKMNVSYLFITHDLATVKAISDEIVVMLQGEIVEQGTKKEILTPPHHEYTELLLSSIPEMNIHWLDNLLADRREKGKATTFMDA